MCSVSEKRCACQPGAESRVTVQDSGQSSSSTVGHSSHHYTISQLLQDYYTVSIVNYTSPYRQSPFFFTANMFYLKISLILLIGRRRGLRRCFLNHNRRHLPQRYFKGIKTKAWVYLRMHLFTKKQCPTHILMSLLWLRLKHFSRIFVCCYYSHIVLCSFQLQYCIDN